MELCVHYHASDCVGMIRKEMLQSSFWSMVTVFLVRCRFTLTPRIINRMCTTTPVVPKMEEWSRVISSPNRRLLICSNKYTLRQRNKGSSCRVQSWLLQNHTSSFNFSWCIFHFMLLLVVMFSDISLVYCLLNLAGNSDSEWFETTRVRFVSVWFVVKM